MSWLETAIARISPRWGLRREIHRRQLDLLRGGAKRRRTFEAVAGGRMRKDMGRTGSSADQAISGDISALREHVRYQEYQSGLFAGPIRRIVNNTVGRGIILRPTVSATDDLAIYQPGPKITDAEADRWNRLAVRVWRRWCKQADMRLINSFYGIQRLALGAMIRDGEVLLIGRTSQRRDRMLPFCVEILEADRLCTPMSETTNPRIRHGIEYDDEGVPAYYYILRQHPGESYASALQRDNFDRVPAFFANGTRKVLHLFDPVRPEQTRGYSVFAPGLLDAQDLDRYREAEKYAAIMAASYVAAVETENPQQFSAAFGQSAGTDTGADGEEYSRREFDFAPGATFVGRPGEKFKFNDPARPAGAFAEYSYDLLQGPANALDMPPEVLAQRWSGLNYSNARTILLQFYASCWIRQGYLINHLCAPVYANLVASAVSAGLLPGNHYGRRTHELLSATWVPMIYRRWIDPGKESSGRETDLRTNVETLTETITELGRDPDEHLEQRARELKRIRELEEKYGVKFPSLGAAVETPALDNEDGDDDGKKGKPRSVLQVLRS